MSFPHSVPTDKHSLTVTFAREIAAFQEAVKVVLHADISGMAFVDRANQETVISASAGHATNNLSGLVIPSGKGLAGKVLRTREPVALGNYMDDMDINHHKQADDAVATEGIKSSIGAPIYTGEQLCGIIYAWRRLDHKFDEKDLQIMAELGQRVSKHIDRSECFEHDEKHEIIKNITTFSTVNHKTNSYYEQILLSCLNSNNIEEAVEILANFLNHPILVFDDLMQLRVMSSGAVVDKVNDSRCLLSLLKEEKNGTVPMHFQNSALNGYLFSIKTGDCLIGYLYVQQGKKAISFAEYSFMTIACRIISTYILLERQVIKRESRFFENALVTLLRGNLNGIVDLLNQHRYSGLNANEPHRLIIFNSGMTKGHADYRRCIENKYRGELICSEIDNHFIVLIKDQGHERALHTARSIIKDINDKGKARKPICIVTEPCSRPEDYSQKFEEACSFLQLVVPQDINEQVISLEQLGPQRLFIHPANVKFLRSYVLDTFGSLIAYDKQKKSLLMDTLIEYFAAGCNRKVAANRLHVHIHTLDYRLNRAFEISRIDLTEPTDKFNIQMAVNAYEVLRVTGHI